jgi:TolB-like protein
VSPTTDGVTEGKKSLKFTALPHPTEATDGSEVTQGLRVNLIPAQSWIEFQELDLDITNPEKEAQHFQVSLIDSLHPAKARRRKAFLMVPGRGTATIRLPLTDAAGNIPQGGMTGWAKTNSVEIDLEHVSTIWLLCDRTPAGQSLIVDNLRLVRRDGAAATTAEAPATHRAALPKLAVLDMQDLTGNLGPKAKLLTALLYDEVAAAHTSEAISASEIVEMLGVERQKQLLGCTETHCLAEIGGALGNDYFLSSQVGRIGSRVRLDIRLIDSRKSKVAASAGDFVAADSDDGLADLAVKLVRQVLRESPLAPPR